MAMHSITKGQDGARFAEFEEDGLELNGVSQTVANAGVLTTAHNVTTGIVLVASSTNNKSGAFLVTNNGGSLVAIGTIDSAFSVTKGTASKINVYIEDNVVKVQNNITTAQDITVKSFS